MTAADAVQLSYLSAGVCLARCVCKHLCTGVPGPCLLSDSAEVPSEEWEGGTGRSEGVLGVRWEAGEQEDPCWG